MKIRSKAVIMACGMLCVMLMGVWNGATVQAGVEVKSEVAIPAATAAKLIVYADGMPSAPYIPSGWMGNQAAIAYEDNWTANPHSGPTCLKLVYKAKDQWAGIIWQHPANDWGDQPGGYNLTGATKLTWWARGEAGGEKVKFVFGVIAADKPHHDTAKGELEVTLTKEWIQYSIDLTNKDLTRIKTGFGWSVGGQGKPLTFYVDDVRYE